MSQEIIEKEIAPIVDNALALKIENSFDLDTGVEILSELNRFNDRITEEKEKITKPLNEALKVERARWKPIETAYETAIEYVRNQMSVFQTAQMKKQAEQEALLAASIDKGDVDMDTALATLDKSVETKINTPFGSVTFRETQFLKITDELLIPREYLVVNDKAVLEALKAGKVVTGAEIEIRSIPVNRR